MTTFKPSDEPMMRLDGLLKWWGTDQSAWGWGFAPASVMTQFQRFLGSVQEINVGAYQAQHDIMADATAHFATQFTALMKSRTPGEAVEAEIALFGALADTVSMQCRAYLDTIRKLNVCVEDLRRQELAITGEASTKDVSKDARPRLLTVSGKARERADAS